MADFSFRKAVDKQYDARLKATAPIKEVDAYIFCTSSKYLGERLFSWQSLALKMIYGLWKKYPITEDEQKIVDILQDVWHLDFDLAKRDPQQVVEILILVLGRRCLKETERVVNPRTGERIPIKDLYAEQTGQVLTLDNTYKLRPTTTPEIYNNGVHKCFTLTTHIGRTITATANHPFLTKGGWKWLGQLREGERIAVPRKLNIIGEEILPDNEVRLLGFFTGDGRTGNKCSFTKSLEKDQAVIRTFVKAHGLWGKLAVEKTVPQTIFKSTNRQIALFLNSLYACSSGQVGDKSISYTTPSKILAEDLQHLLLRFGINAAIRSRQLSHKVNARKESHRTSYVVEITSKKDINIFVNKISILGRKNQLNELVARKRCEYSNTQTYGVPRKIWQYVKKAVKRVGRKFNCSGEDADVSCSPNRDRFDELLDDPMSDVCWATIKSIEYCGEHQTYDLTIPDTHNFVCEDIITHNSGKSSFISFIQTYEAYKLICKGDPQRFYNIRADHPIWIVNTAKDGDQAQDPFRFCKDNIRRIPFFQKYIDWSKDNESELRLFTPSDLYENDQIRKFNEDRPKGSSKKSLKPGSIMVAAFTTTAASKRGKAIIMLILDEFAHFDRAKTSGGGLTEEDILAEMPQTDYAMLKALSPATKDFHLRVPEDFDGDENKLWRDVDNDENYLVYDGKIIMISSPREKGGEFYKHYCLAGGMEQANPQRSDLRKNYLLMQMTSWHCNPKYTQNSFASDFKKDPVGANMEFGAHFGEPSTSFIDSTKVDEMVDENRPLSYVGRQAYKYIISVDPAAKGDTYALCWGHMEQDWIIIDGIHGFRPEIVSNDATGQLIKVPVNPIKVVGFIRALAFALNQHGDLLEVVYDQWNSSESILTLKSEGYVAVETFFTNKYKNEIYTNFLEKLNIGKIRTFGRAPLTTLNAFPPYQEGWLDQTKLELKYLNRITSGNTVYYAAPTTGPIQTDDFADVLANLSHRLMLYASGDRTIYKELYKQTKSPIKHSPGFRSTVAPSLFNSGNPYQNKLDRLKGRIRGR